MVDVAELFEQDDPFGDIEDQDVDPLATSNNDNITNINNPNPPPPASKPRPTIMSAAQIQQIKQMKMKAALSNAVNQVLADQEQKLDNKIDKLSKLTDDDLEELRLKRLEQLKKKQIQRQKWLQNNHGIIHELRDQKHFFDNVKSTKHCICLFYSKTNKWCNLLQQHLKLLAQKHLECKFVQIESQFAPFLIEKLNIWMMPTLVLAKDNKVSTQLSGLDWVAPDGKIETIKLEQKLYEYGFLEETYIAIENSIKKYGINSLTGNNKNQMQQDDDSDDDLFDD